GAGPALAAAVVEEAQTPLARAPHDFPVLEIVRGELARVGGVAGVIGQHLVPEVEAKHAAHRPALRVGYREDLAIFAEHGRQAREVAFCERRRAVTMD